MSQRKRNLPRGWYPVDQKDCQREIESYLEGWTPPQLPSKGIGGIVPHAGWYFSGRLAVRVFSSLKTKRKIILKYCYFLKYTFINKVLKASKSLSSFSPS